jgi:hypothetical protein
VKGGKGAAAHKLFTNEGRNEQGPHLYDVNYGTSANLDCDRYKLCIRHRRIRRLR